MPLSASWLSFRRKWKQPGLAVVEPVNPDLPQQPSDGALGAAVRRVEEVAQSIESLIEAGWGVTDGLTGCSLSIADVESGGLPQKEILDSVADVSDAHLRLSRGPAALDLDSTSGSSRRVANLEGDPARAFADDELKQAQSAWDGDVDAAMGLTGRWSGRVTVYLGAPIARSDPKQEWRVVRSVDVISNELRDNYPWWRSRELIVANGRSVSIAVVAPEDIDIQTRAFAVRSLNILMRKGEPSRTGVESRLEQVRSCTAAQLPIGVALPEELDPGDLAVGVEGLQEVLRRYADACAWAWLSNSTTITDGGKKANLEFFGYRRRIFQLGAEGYSAATDAQRAAHLYRWATVDELPDRVLAIRQVMSLQEGNQLPEAPYDVRRAAEPIFLALRTGEVAAVLESQRQARAFAVDAARESAGAAQSAAKSAAERTIASLAAVGGIAVANATAVLRSTDAIAFATGIAILFTFLAVWTLLIEGLAMGSPIRSFKTDLPTTASLLGQRDLEAVGNMNVLKRAQHAVWRARIGTPAVYASGAVVSLAVAHYRFGSGFWP